ncbi:MAG TPA: IS66 family insertion sequence element accessory protein TnpB [Chitinispirillaceae bacterium]|nr:IS66 family insertion sequence element accessory protein TnpB [Chitinispirillaceae bacterium]
MLSFPSTVKVFACKEPIDMRKSFDGLCGCVQQLLGADPLSGHLFAFFNKRATMVKVLLWDRTGFCIWCKRLEKGCFHIQSLNENGNSLELPQLMLILEGIDLAGARQRKRYRLPSAA